jgi:polyisoprenoid-binding protein YceI
MATTTWILDKMHSELGFKIRHLMISNVSGSFKNFGAEIETEEKDFSTARINLTAEINSIFTNNEHRDAHLLNSDFFEVEKYPALTFKSTKVEKTDNDTFALYGALTMKGITQPVKLNVEYNGIAKDHYGQEKAGFVVTGKINRNDWGMNFNAATETGGLVLGEDVKINADIQLVKQGVAVPA